MELTIVKEIQMNDMEFQRAFREYFNEFGVILKENTDIFDELQKAKDCEGMTGMLLKDKDKIIGFILYQIERFESSSHFFTEKVGYIRELWIDKAFRNQKLGTKLLQETYDSLKELGVHKILLTYDEDAIGFYEKLGYEYDNSYLAKNQLRCLVRYLS